VVGQDNAPHSTAAAPGAQRDVDACQLFEQVLPLRWRFVLISGAVIGGGRGLQQPSGNGELGVDVAGGEQAVVPDLGEALWQDMEQEAPDELVWLQSGGLSVAGGEGHCVVGDGLQAVV